MIDSIWRERLKTVEDPDLGLPIVDMGLIYSVEENSDSIVVQMTLTTVSCPAGEELILGVKDRTQAFSEGKKVEVKLVWEPKWDPYTMASEEVKEELGLW